MSETVFTLVLLIITLGAMVLIVALTRPRRKPTGQTGIISGPTSAVSNAELFWTLLALVTGNPIFMLLLSTSWAMGQPMPPAEDMMQMMMNIVMTVHQFMAWYLPYVLIPSLVILLLITLYSRTIVYRAHCQPKEALTDYRPRVYLLKPGNPTSFSQFRPNGLDRLILLSAGAFAGLLGIAIGEISNTFLTVRQKIPIKISTGTSALILHLTILSALAMNLIILNVNPSFFHAEQIAIPWRVAAIIAPVVLVGGQIGSFINSRLTDRTIMQVLITVYTLVGIFVMERIIFA